MKKIKIALCVILSVLYLSSLCACSSTYVDIYKVVSYNDLSLVIHDDSHMENITYYVNGDMTQEMKEKYLTLNLKKNDLIKATWNINFPSGAKISDIKVSKGS